MDVVCIWRQREEYDYYVHYFLRRWWMLCVSGDSVKNTTITYIIFCEDDWCCVYLETAWRIRLLRTLFSAKMMMISGDSAKNTTITYIIFCEDDGCCVYLETARTIRLLRTLFSAKMMDVVCIWRQREEYDYYVHYFLRRWWCCVYLDRQREEYDYYVHYFLRRWWMLCVSGDKREEYDYYVHYFLRRWWMLCVSGQSAMNTTITYIVFCEDDGCCVYLETAWRIRLLRTLFSAKMTGCCVYLETAWRIRLWRTLFSAKMIDVVCIWRQREEYDYYVHYFLRRWWMLCVSGDSVKNTTITYIIFCEDDGCCVYLETAWKIRLLRTLFFAKMIDVVCIWRQREEYDYYVHYFLRRWLLCISGHSAMCITYLETAAWRIRLLRTLFSAKVMDVVCIWRQREEYDYYVHYFLRRWWMLCVSRDSVNNTTITYIIFCEDDGCCVYLETAWRIRLLRTLFSAKMMDVVCIWRQREEYDYYVHYFLRRWWMLCVSGDSVTTIRLFSTTYIIFCEDDGCCVYL